MNVQRVELVVQQMSVAKIQKAVTDAFAQETADDLSIIKTGIEIVTILLL